MIYVLHFERPFHHAQHYIGFSSRFAKEDRIAVDIKGGKRAPKMLQAVVKAGIKIEVGSVFEGIRKDERRIKRSKAASPSRGRLSVCYLCRYLYKERQYQSTIDAKTDL